jgi:hypothetical protein
LYLVMKCNLYAPPLQAAIARACRRVLLTGKDVSTAT